MVGLAVDAAELVGAGAEVHQTLHVNLAARRYVAQAGDQLFGSGDEEVRREGLDRRKDVLAIEHLVPAGGARLGDREPAPRVAAEEPERGDREPLAARRVQGGRDHAVQLENERRADTRTRNAALREHHTRHADQHETRQHGGSIGRRPDASILPFR